MPVLMLSVGEYSLRARLTFRSATFSRERNASTTGFDFLARSEKLCEGWRLDQRCELRGQRDVRRLLDSHQLKEPQLFDLDLISRLDHLHLLLSDRTSARETSS